MCPAILSYAILHINMFCLRYQDNLYRFMRERYLLEEISFFAAYDLLSAIAEYSNTNKVKYKHIV